MAIINLINQYESNLTKTINLVASENQLSANVKKALSSDLAMRYSIPPENERPPGIWDYPNQNYIRQITSKTELLAKKLLDAAYVDVRPLSGNQVAQIILMSLVASGDNVWSIPSNCGGHFSTTVIAAKAGINLFPIPYDEEHGVIDIERVKKLSRQHPPRLVFLDASMQLFPHPLKELREALGFDVIIAYDASHTLGLIVGGAFQNPLQEGANLISGSTHKTLWGPQKGLIAVREDGQIARIIHDAVVPFFVSNVHVHHVAALGVALEESRDFGADYAKAVIANAKALAYSLNNHGMDVLFHKYGATESHQILVDLGDKITSIEAWNRLQIAGINTNAISLPFRQTYGLRIGVAEATRRGFGVNEMNCIGGWMAECVRNSLSVEYIATHVAEMSEQFSFLHYTH
jgi:glycine hydroxymethyltransferase